MSRRIPENLRRPINKVEQAMFLLDQLTAELEKPDVRLWAVAAYLGGCLGAVQSAFYALANAHPGFKAVNRRWRMSLPLGDREFMNRMMAERDNDVHFGGTTLQLNFNLGGIVLRHDPTVQPSVQPVQTELQLNLSGHPVEIAGACGRFIALMTDLIKQFRE